VGEWDAHIREGRVTTYDPLTLYGALLSAGAIITGFCGTFLSFRIQREASYYRQPAVDFATGSGKDVFVNLTHFSSGFLLLSLASLGACIFGVVFPLLGLAGVIWFLARAGAAVAGVIGSLVLLVSYFVDELVHYRILSSRLANDAREWGREWIVVCIGIAVAAGAAVLVVAVLA
jgi:hypothetical protein